MKNKFLLFSVCLNALISLNLMAQNLVPNPEFENYQSCPSGTNQLASSTGNWGATSITSPDYFNTCAPLQIGTGVGIPHNNFGFQYPASGSGYAGFYAYTSQFAGAREYVCSPLSTPLTIGGKYYVRFKVSAAYKVSGNPGLDPTVAVSHVGLRFTVTNPINTFYTVPNTADVYSTTIVGDTSEWTTISGSFIATENSGYLMIGNHFQDNAIQIQGIAQAGTSGAAYYFVDDVCVSMDSLDCINLPVGKAGKMYVQNMMVYPNPAIDVIRIDIPEGYRNNGSQLSVRNISGVEVFRTEVFRGDLAIQTASWGAKGLYLIELRDQNLNRTYVTKVMLE